jgi:hypothetical protein
MPRCDVCGTSFDVDGYHVVANGRLYDSIECAMRVRPVRPTVDATTAWVAAARERLGIDDDSTNGESEPADP